MRARLPDAQLVVANTDRARLEACQVPVKIALGERRTRGLGAGGQPEIGAEAAEDVADVIAGICDRTQQVILVAALGGGTGTGAAPVIARIARRHGCRTVVVVTEPFPFEGKRRVHRAAAGLQALAGVDLLMTVPLGDLLPVLGRSITLGAAWHAGATVASTAVELLPMLLTKPGPERREVVDIRAMLALVGRTYQAAR
jgi:cell division protein FtsZ